MKITNKANLPAPLVAMASDNYPPQPGVYRVTSLLKSVREVLLERRHWDELESDVADRIWLLFGTAVHSVLERQPEGAMQFSETRLTMPVGEYTLSGQFDLYDAGEEMVIDYKTASVWKIIFGDYTDWRRQLLVYAYMLRSIGFAVRRGQIVAFLKDHVKSKAAHDPSYPQQPVVTVSFDFAESDFKECEEWLQAKFAAIAEAEALPDEALPLCTAEERWNRSEKWAVMAKGKKKARKLCDSEAEAELWLMNNSGDYIQYRPGEDRKCLDYCSAHEFCDYYRALMEAKEEERHGIQDIESGRDRVPHRNL